MILVIDCGNTHLVGAVATETSISEVFRIPTSELKTSEQSEEKLRRGLSEISPAGSDANPGLPHHAMVASVVPGITPHLIAALTAITGTKPLTLKDPQVELNIDIDIERPDEVGDDRLVNVAGLSGEVPLPALIIDFGTATTIDLVHRSEAGRPVYSGGIIAPGVHRSVEALVAAAAQLSPIEIEAFGPELPVLGKNTEQAMKSGILWGYVSLIDGLIARLASHIGQDCPAVATGGLAPLFAPHIPSITYIDPNLTLRGLYHIFMHSQRR